ncbi:MAG: polyketide cyclase/dehydrase and lipid transport [Leptospiraceae bacterium]|nr:polyketide cyclase/dehydrase and lipid transport [Leptospiraceae bacterium]
MVETIVEGTINKPILEVFEFVSNLETMIQYNSSIRESKWKKEGSICKIKVGLSIITFDSEYIITEFTKNKTFTAKCNHFSLDFEDVYEFKEDGNSTILKITDRMKLKGILALSEGILKKNMKDEMMGNMNRLISILNAR